MRKLIIASFMLTCLYGVSQPVVKTFRVDKNFINIPIETKQPRQRVEFKVNGKVVTSNDIRIAKDNVDYWTFIDVSKYMGKEFSFEFSDNVSGIEKIYQSVKFEGEDMLYKEKLRPQVHFTTRRGWNNDPNGLVYYKGEYHLYYQHNPYETTWGNMSWGHAVSEDLLHWKELPVAIEPDELGTIFSGSAVIDYNNTSGFKNGSENPLVAIYTADFKNSKQQQCIAYSLDKGRTFTKYEGNPVIPAKRRFGSGHERDPKVFWYEPGKHWVLVMHDGLNYSIYSSANLKEWNFESSVNEGFWECPELFELAVDGNLNNKKWVMYGVKGTYLIGDFDGKKFTPETEKLGYNVGGMSAAQTFNDEPNGRRLQIGWGHAQFPNMPFCQTFTFIQEFNLKTTRSGIRLFIEPAKEIEKLHTRLHKFENEYIGNEINKKLAAIKTPVLHIKIKFEIDNSNNFGIDINEYKIRYNVTDNTLNGNFLPLQNRQLDLEIIVDRSLIEVYGNGGLMYWFGNIDKVDSDDFKISFIQGKSGLNPDPKTLIKKLEINELKSIWEK